MLFISSDLPWLYPYQARIRLHLPVHAAAERLPPTAGHLQADGENACILHTGAESPDVLAIYVAISAPTSRYSTRPNLPSTSLP